MITKGYLVSFWSDQNVLRLVVGMVVNNSVNLLKATGLYTVNGGTVCIV